MNGAELIGPADAMDYLRAIVPTFHRDLLEWSVACYWRGIITHDELQAKLGADVDSQHEIEQLRLDVACWLTATPFPIDEFRQEYVERLAAVTS